MTGEFKSLPIEIFDKAFQYLESDSLKECRNVCRLWQPNATRHFMNYVTFRNVDQILKFLELPHNITSLVKKMKINDYSSTFSKNHFQQLMINVPNLQELKFDHYSLLCDLNDIVLPTRLTSITFYSLYGFNIKQGFRKYTNILNKLCNTIQRFNIVINPEMFENLDIISFFGSFTKLIDLDVRGIYSIECLTDCLPIIQAIPSLKTISIYTNNDIDSELICTSQLQQKLGALERLNFTASHNSLPHTLRFIIRNFIGLKEINATFFPIAIENLHDSTILLEFLNFTYSLDRYCIDFNIPNHMFRQRDLTDIIYNSFNRLPEKNQNVSKQLQINLNYSWKKNMYYKFQLNSFRDYCNRLQRQIEWNIVHDETHMDQLLKCLELSDIINVDTFTFHMVHTSFLSYSIHLFFEIMSMIKSKKVVLKVASHSKWSTYVPSKKFKHIPQLEIHLIGEPSSLLDKDNVLFSLDIFSNLKILHLNHWCGTWHPERKTYLVEIPLLNLETLHLPIAQPVLEAIYSDCKVMLVIETSTGSHLYEFSAYPFSVTKKSQEVQTENYHFQLCIKLPSIQNLYLYDSAHKTRIAISI